MKLFRAVTRPLPASLLYFPLAIEKSNCGEYVLIVGRDLGFHEGRRFLRRDSRIEQGLGLVELLDSTVRYFLQRTATQRQTEKFPLPRSTDPVPRLCVKCKTSGRPLTRLG